MELTVEQLVKKALKDEVIIFQTDTVYGIGTMLNSEEGVKSIYQIKGREANKPLAILCASIEDVKPLVKDFEAIKPLAETYWPGALTIIAEKTENVPNYITKGFNTVGVRIPNDRVALKILKAFGPMAVTSLNYSNEPAILKYDEALTFEKNVDYIVKGTDLSALSSTVYDSVSKNILRQGDIKL